MAKEIKLPQISEGVDSAEVAEVMVSAGDSISEGDSMIAVETDKASVEVPCTSSGKIKEVKVKEGGEIKVGDVILVLEEDGSGSDEEEKEDAEEEKSSKEEVAADEDEGEDAEDKSAENNDEDTEDNQEAEEEQDQDDDGKEESDAEEDQDTKLKKGVESDDKDKIKEPEDKEYKAIAASPSVRRLARELGVDIQSVQGSGEKGRISESDVKNAQSTEEASADVSKSALPDFSKWGHIERQKMSAIRKATAKSTSNSWAQIPHVTQFDQSDVTELENYRKKMQEKSADVKITVTAILTKIAVSALQRFPIFNASVNMASKEIILKHYYHIGIAVDTEKGLLVPVIKDADKKSVYDIAAEITSLSEKARDQKLSPEEMQGGTFVISNLGGIGGTQFTPIVYHPQVAIMGVSRTSVQPVYIDEAFQPRHILPLSLSYDHRVIDGASGAKFLRWICDAMEDPLKAILGA